MSPRQGKRNSGESYADIYSMIQTAVQNAKTYFMQCGNAIVQPEDEDVFTAEVLYMFFNRSSCCNEPFQSRVERVVVDTMQAKGKIIALTPCRIYGRPTSSRPVGSISHITTSW